MSTQDRYCEDRSDTIECPGLNAFALHEKGAQFLPGSRPLLLHYTSVWLKRTKTFSYQKQQHPAGISLVVSLKMVFQSMFYD